MTRATSETKKARRPLTFLAGFIKNPKEVGSVIPSSRALIRRIVRFGEVERARVVVELGPGTGVVTKEMLKRMPANGKLLAMEINPLYVKTLRDDIADPRLHIYQGPATEIEKALAEIGETTADLAVSGIPFSTMPQSEGEATIRSVNRTLGKDGKFLAYQFRAEVRRLGERILGPAEQHQGYWNIPPMRIWLWDKQPEAGGAQEMQSEA